MISASAGWRADHGIERGVVRPDGRADELADVLGGKKPLGMAWNRTTVTTKVPSVIASMRRGIADGARSAQP